MANSVPREQKGGSQKLSHKTKKDFKLAREACLAASNMNKELLQFLSRNASSKEPVTIPAHIKPWFVTKDDLATSSRKGMWMNTKLLASTS